MQFPTLNFKRAAITSRSPLLSINGQLEWSIRVPLKVVARPDDQFYTTKSGDHLTKIAFSYFGDVRLWWVIYDYNAVQLVGINPMYLPGGVTLRLPSAKTLQLEVLNGDARI